MDRRLRSSVVGSHPPRASVSSGFSSRGSAIDERATLMVCVLPKLALCLTCHAGLSSLVPLLSRERARVGHELWCSGAPLAGKWVGAHQRPFGGVIDTVVMCSCRLRQAFHP